MADKSFLIDTTKCTACRACQVACKQWNELPAESTTNQGTYENPPDLSANTWLLVHFKENGADDGTLAAWNFVRNSCRHCLEAPCKQAAANSDSITIDEQTGAVLFQESTANEDFAKIRAACPFDIPRRDQATGQMYKCVMCVDRVHNGKLPACAQVCPSGAIQFGDREDIVSMAEERVEAIRGQFPNATILDRRDVRLLILLGDRESMYKLRAAATT